MPTKSESESLFVMGEDGNYMPLGNEIENISVELQSQLGAHENEIGERWCKAQCASVLTLPLSARKKRRSLTAISTFHYLCGHSNNWLKMQGYPMMRSIALRKRRTRSKKKDEKRNC